MRIQARAKINWTLDVLGKRADGYHELDMLMQSVALCDFLTIEKDGALSLALAGNARVPATPDNLVLRAANALRDYAGYAGGARITLEKHIPVGAGMGGGSADAAAVLVGLNRLWGLDLPASTLERIGLSVGADVPFCVRGGLQRAQGVGERLTPLRCARFYWLVVAQPCRGLSTRQVFGALRTDEIPACARPDNARAQAALENGSLCGLTCAMGNALQPTAASLQPEIVRAARLLCEHGARRALMTGSGSAVYGVFANAPAARAARQALARRFPYCAMTHTCDQGVAGETGEALF